MPQLAPMPWVSLLILLFFCKSLIFTSLWAHRPAQFGLSLSTADACTHTPWPWTN